MKILLIAPASGRWQNVGKARFFNGRAFRFSLLSLLSVAAETPSEHSIRIVDEQIEDIPWDADVDLVGITCMTALAPRAYQIAVHFRERGIPVILGGMHPTFMPNEGLRHADAVLVGEAEGIWQTALEDASAGRLKGLYKSIQPCDLASLRPIPRDLLSSRGYATLHAVQATRGCPRQCNFCSVSAFCGGNQRQRPVESVVHEVKGMPGSNFIFVDDNLTADREYAKHLFAELIPLKKKWMTQSALSVAEDAELVDLASKAGCRGFFAGLETFSSANLEGANKSFNHVENYRDAVEFLHSRGIGVEAGIVFGFDGDDPGVFERTLTLLDLIRVDLVQASIFTPLPGTSRFEAMKERITDSDWSHYDFHHAVFQPSGMSAVDLQAGHDWFTSEFYRPWRIARRLAWRMAMPNGIETMPYATALNLAYYGRVRRWNFRGWNPEKKKHFYIPLSASWGTGV